MNGWIVWWLLTLNQNCGKKTCAMKQKTLDLLVDGVVFLFFVFGTSQNRLHTRIQYSVDEYDESLLATFCKCPSLKKVIMTDYSFRNSESDMKGVLFT